MARWGRLSRIVGGLALAASFVAASRARATTRAAAELLRQAVAHEAAREDDLAARRYTEALSLDPTCGECYLGLGALRLRRGDAREADRVYTLALIHLPLSLEALHGRAVARRAAGEAAGSEEDLAEYAEKSGKVDALRELARWFGEDGAVPRQLAIWRRILERARHEEDTALEGEARTMVRALQILVGPADPVIAPPTADPTRRALSRIAKRGG